MIDVDDRADALIQHFEGLSLTPYRDAVGVPTIGFGATWGLDGHRVTMAHRPITEAEARALYERDVQRFARAVGRLITVPISSAQAGALTSFCYNLGAGALQASTLRRRVNALEWDDVPYQFGRWVHAGGRRLAGLVRRRAAEAGLFMADYSSLPRAEYFQIYRPALRARLLSIVEGPGAGYSPARPQNQPDS